MSDTVVDAILVVTPSTTIAEGFVRGANGTNGTNGATIVTMPFAGTLAGSAGAVTGYLVAGAARDAAAPSVEQLYVIGVGLNASAPVTVNVVANDLLATITFVARRNGNDSGQHGSFGAGTTGSITIHVEGATASTDTLDIKVTCTGGGVGHSASIVAVLAATAS